jgi:hypothetical protein
MVHIEFQKMLKDVARPVLFRRSSHFGPFGGASVRWILSSADMLPVMFDFHVGRSK